MRRRSLFFRPVDPFTIHKNLMEWETASSQIIWLRYLSLITDLETLNIWKMDSAVRSNMDRNQDPVYVIKQYRSVMNSSTMQVFMLGYQNIPVCLLKSMLAQASPWALSLPGLPGDGLLEFIFREDPRSPVTLSEILRKFTGYYLSSQAGSHIGIPIPANDVLNARAVEEAGFQLTDLLIQEGQEYKIYRSPSG